MWWQLKRVRITLCFENLKPQLPSGGLVYRLKLREWSWIKEEEREAAKGPPREIELRTRWGDSAVAEAIG